LRASLDALAGHAHKLELENKEFQAAIKKARERDLAMMSVVGEVRREVGIKCRCKGTVAMLMSLLQAHKAKRDQDILRSRFLPASASTSQFQQLPGGSMTYLGKSGDGQPAIPGLRKTNLDGSASAPAGTSPRRMVNKVGSGEIASKSATEGNRSASTVSQASGTLRTSVYAPDVRGPLTGEGGFSDADARNSNKGKSVDMAVDLGEVEKLRRRVGALETELESYKGRVQELEGEKTVLEGEVVRQVSICGCYGSAGCLGMWCVELILLQRAQLQKYVDRVSGGVYRGYGVFG
jgi:hypothetical protein